jgi:hypothetical protein
VTAMTTISQKLEKNILIEGNHCDDEMTAMTTISKKCLFVDLT